MTLALFFAFLFSEPLPYIVTDLLPTGPKMEALFEDFAKLADQKLDRFVIASEKKLFDEAYEAWDDVCSSFYNLQFIYYQTIMFSESLVDRGYAGRHVLNAHQIFRKYLNEKKIQSVFNANGFQAALLTPFQRYLTEKIVGGAPNPDEESWEKLFQYERRNYLSQEYPPSKPVSISNKFKVLTANVLCFPEQFSYFFGGVSPWANRIDSIVAKIISSQADVVCLQEIWNGKIGKALAEKLKKRFNYFIYDAGNQYGTLSPEEIGFNSGLFIASKIPLDTVSFIPFTRMKPMIAGIKRGAIRAKITVGDAKWTMVATHLQAGCDDDEEQIRKDELAECVEFLGSDPGFIIGDLNINAFSNEFQTSILSKNFFIPYLYNKSAVNKHTATATDFFNDLTHTPPADRKMIKPTFGLFDYCAISKKTNGMKLIGQEKLTLFSIKDPSGALSDHHGIITTWQVR